MNFDRLLPFDPARELVRVVIETPRGSRCKYAYDRETQTFALSRLLPAGMAFPFDFGFIPRTRAPDGDPLDVVVVVDGPLFPGCVVDCRLLGVVEAEQTEKGGRTTRNDRLIAAPCVSGSAPGIRSLDDLPPGLVDEVRGFFATYHARQGRTFTPLANRGPDVAWSLLEAAHRAG